jgi:hypothetical protein
MNERMEKRKKGKKEKRKKERKKERNNEPLIHFGPVHCPFFEGNRP